MKRRNAFSLLCGLLAAAGVPAQPAYPAAKPITFVVPSPPGGAVDVLARALANEMSRQMGQTILVENRAGAGGMLAAQMVAQAAPDGYTLLVTHSGPVLTTPYMVANVRYDVRRDFAFVSQLCTGSLVLAVNAAVPARNMKEFLAWAGQNKGKFGYGSYGVGSSGHLMSAYLDQSRKLDMTHVAYKGEAPLLQDLAGGQVQWAVMTSGVLAPQIQGGRVRAIAILGNQRLDDLPGVPTMAEAGLPDPEFRPLGWAGVLAPAQTPPAVLARLEHEVRAATQTTAMKARFQVFGMVPLGTTSAEFRRDYETAAPLVERLVKLSGAKAD